MKVLLIEDDNHKSKQIKDYILSQWPQIEIEICRSYQTGLRTAFRSTFDLILLDMSLPTFDIKSGEDGYRFLKRAGEDILRELKRKRYNSKVIIVTQFDSFGEGDNYIDLKELKKQLLENYSDNYIDTVYYDPSQSKWKSELKILISKTIFNNFI